MKTVFRDGQDYNGCCMYIDTDMGERDVLDFYAPCDGGYVTVVSSLEPDRGRRQICEGLRQHGDTLRWDGEGRLIDFIRREYRKGRRWDASDQA